MSEPDWKPTVDVLSGDGSAVKEGDRMRIHPVDGEPYDVRVGKVKPGPDGSFVVETRPWGERRWVSLFGMDPDFTGGLSTQEYLDEMRGDASPHEPETVDEALEDVHRRYCVPDAHDPVCQILHAAVGE